MNSKPTTITPPCLGQWALASTFLGIALAGSAISLYLNVTFGWQIGHVIGAAAFALAEVALFAIPFTKASMGWNPRRRTAWAICLVMSLVAASTHILEMLEQRSLDMAAISANARGARSDEGRIRKELETIIETGDAAALQAVYDATRKAAQEAEFAARAKGITCPESKVCRGLAAKRDETLVKLGAAKRRDELNGLLKAATSKVEAAPAERSDMGMGYVAKLTGINKESLTSGVSTGMMALVMLVLVMAAGFSGDAGIMLGTAINQRKAARAANAPKKVEVAPAASTPRTRKDDALLKLQTMVWKAPGGVLVASKNSIWNDWKADGFTVSRTVFYEWCDEWQAAGDIEVTGNGKNQSEIRARRLAA